MKFFVLTTTSESGDHYIYYIQHPKKPTLKELEKFLEKYASDKDEDQVYEYVDTIEEVGEYQKIPH